MKLKHVLALTIVCLAQAVGAYQPLLAEPYENAIDAIEKNDFPLALKILNPLAGKGDEKAQTLLGQMYMNGWGVPQNFKRATERYEVDPIRRTSARRT